ncbi:phage capsid protein, partial [Staphylococcus aureus]
HAIYAKYEPIMYNKKKQALKGVYQFALNYVFDIKIVPELLRMVKVK